MAQRIYFFDINFHTLGNSLELYSRASSETGMGKNGEKMEILH